MKCPICGHKSSLKESICSNCGYRFNDKEIVEEQTKEPKRKKVYRTYKKIDTIGNIILLIIAICTGIPIMIHAFQSNIDNHINNYGTYSLYEFEEMGIESSSVNLLKNYKDKYDQYLLGEDFEITAESIIYYLSSGTTSTLRYYINNNETYGRYYIELQFSENDLERTELRISNSYKGDLGDSFTYIHLDDIKIIEELIEFEDTYQMFKETFDKIKVTDKEFVNAHSEISEYIVVIHEQQYDDSIQYDYSIIKEKR